MVCSSLWGSVMVVLWWFSCSGFVVVFCGGFVVVHGGL